MSAMGSGCIWLPHNRHVVGKGLEANRNEGLHSVLRGKLNRLVRRTRGYTRARPCCGTRWPWCVCDRVGYNTPARIENTEINIVL